MLKDYYTFDEVEAMPIRELFAIIEDFKPKFKEIARQKENARLQAELEGKRRQQKNQRQGAMRKHERS